MSVIAKINIHGHIGPSYVDEKGLFHKGVELIDLVEQVESQKDAKEFEVSINSPGGYADIGDAMYEYLMGLKSKGKVTTIQSGLVGSIATKIFLAGDERIVDDRYKFWIHNPFMDNVSGDQDQLRAYADGLAQTEDALRKFYSSFTTIDENSLDTLMKLETGLTADQCLKFGFATSKKQIPVFNLIKMNEKSFIDHVKAFFTEEKKKGVQPKAQIPGQTEQKSMVVELADGAGSFWVEGESLNVGANAFLLDESGQPTAEQLADATMDNPYVLKDGTKVTVKGGKIESVTPSSTDPAMDQQAATFTQDQVNEMVNIAVQKALSEQANTLKSEAKAEVDAAILAFKKEARIGVPPKRAVVVSPDVNKSEYKTIAQINQEKYFETKNKRK